MRLFVRLLAAGLWAGSLPACTSTQPAAESSSSYSSSSAALPAGTFDLPILVGRNIDQLRRGLGTPHEATQQTMGMEPTPEQMRLTRGEDWINTFEKNNTTVVATFNARTRRVRDLVIVGTDEDEMMSRTNLSFTDPDYTVESIVNPEKPTQTIGLRVTPKRQSGN